MDKMLVKIAKEEINISNLEKVFWPQEGYRKGDLIDYYLSISKYILPHLIDRPFVMKRYPEGIKGNYFYQKNCPGYAPHWIKKTTINAKNMILCNDVDTLIWLINLGCIELHHWLARFPHLDKPDIIVFDLDPEPPASFKDTLQVALIIYDIMKVANLKCYAKTSGSKGLHIYIPIIPEYKFALIKDTLKVFCKYLTDQYPQLVTIEMKKEMRKGKVYLDYLQNGYGKTMAGVYSVRAVDGALVSTPLLWKEIKEGIEIADFNIKNIQKRLNVVGDLFAEVNSSPQDFSPFVKTLLPSISRKRIYT